MLRFRPGSVISVFFLIASTLFAAEPKPLVELTERGSRVIERNAAVLIIESDPPGASVIQNGIHIGNTPLRVANLNPGLYPFVLSKTGHAGRTVLLEVETGKEKQFLVILSAVTGFLRVTVTPPGAAVFIDNTEDRNHKDGVIREITAGEHLVEARLFGYETKTTQVMVAESAMAHAVLNLVKITQTVTINAISPSPFNPELAERGGRLALDFSVSASGRAVVAIFSKSREIWRNEINDLSDWRHVVYWDGIDSTGRVVGDGTYLAVVTAFADGSTYSVSKEASVLVSRKRPIFSALIHGGGVGTGTGRTTQILPRGSQEIGLSFSPVKYWPILTKVYSEASYFPLSFHYALSPTDTLEYSFSVGAGLTKDYYLKDAPPVEAGLAIKQVFKKSLPQIGDGSSVHFGYLAHAHLSTNSTEFPEDPSSFGIGFLLGFYAEQRDSAWYAGYAADISFPIVARDPGNNTNLNSWYNEAEPGTYISSDLPTVFSNTIIFKWQDNKVARTLYLSYDSMFALQYAGLPVPDDRSSAFPNMSVPVPSTVLGFEGLQKVPNYNVVFSLGGMVNYFKAKVKVMGTAGVWFYF